MVCANNGENPVTRPATKEPAATKPTTKTPVVTNPTGEKKPAIKNRESTKPTGSQPASEFKATAMASLLQKPPPGQSLYIVDKDGWKLSPEQRENDPFGACYWQGFARGEAEAIAKGKKARREPTTKTLASNKTPPQHVMNKRAATPSKTTDSSSAADDLLTLRNILHQAVELFEEQCPPDVARNAGNTALIEWVQSQELMVRNVTGAIDAC